MTIPKISDSEWEVMKLVWKNHPLSSDDIVSSLVHRMNCSPQTIKTFINRLVKKGALGYGKTDAVIPISLWFPRKNVF